MDARVDILFCLNYESANGLFSPEVFIYSVFIYSTFKALSYKVVDYCSQNGLVNKRWYNRVVENRTSFTL